MHHEATDKLIVKRLNKVERKELFKAIRFIYLPHQELLKLSTDPIFEIAKDFILEALAYKLDQTAHMNSGEQLQTNSNPRVYYDRSSIVPKSAAPVEQPGTQNL